MFKHNDGSTEVVMMEAGEILVGATAKEIAPHAESSWERGQTALEALRDRHGRQLRHFRPGWPGLAGRAVIKFASFDSGG